MKGEIPASDSRGPGARGRMARLRDRLALRAAGRAAAPTGLAWRPEPRSIGSFALGRQLLAGNFIFEGFLVEAPGLSIWDAPAPDARFAAALQDFGWLDDLAAVGDRAARDKAQAWTFDWIARYGAGAGWAAPEQVGRRLIRQVSHALLLLNGRSRPEAQALFAVLGRQAAFLSRRWPAARSGLPRFEALAGLLHAALALEGCEALIEPAQTAIEAECAAAIDAEGAIAARNPEDLAQILSLLTWSADALSEAGRAPGPAQTDAIQRIAPTLRALRHADGGLARFQGGGRGAAGRLDAALAASGSRAPAREGLAMGFARMQGARVSVIVDAAAPPMGSASARAHASTLAFEMTSDRRPLVVNCGAGESFGPEWGLAGRATASHSTLAIDGYSSSRLGPERRSGAEQARSFDETPREVWMQAEDDPARHALFGHDGYVPTHGLTHLRDLALSPDGRRLSGIDTLGAMTTRDARRFDRLLGRAGVAGAPYRIRFHLHPDVDAALDLGGWAVSMALRSGELWVFRFDGPVELSLEPSVYLERGRLKPKPCLQIVLSGRLLERTNEISWTFEKAQDTPAAIQDDAAQTAPAEDI